MVCQGTKPYVLLELRKLGIRFSKFELGEIELESDLSITEIRKLDDSLRQYGLAIMFRKSKIVEKIRNTIHDLVKENINLKTSFSYYISNSLGHKYTYLNKYFKEETGIPIEEYYLEKKNERAEYNELNWSEVFNLQEESA
jgi:YesN/AraC family two-component response regulator